MAARKELQFEKLIDEATRKKAVQSLEQFLATENCENISYKCSKQFVNKLDKLLCQELDKKEFRSVCTVLNCIEKHGKQISIAGEDGLPAMMKFGLIGRMANWFEKVKEIVILGGTGKTEALINLAEDFFSVLLAICDSGHEGKMQVAENFVLRTCTLIADARVSVYVQQEVVRKFNLILDNTPRDARKKIFSTKEMLLAMCGMGERILDAGDYDLQVAITEALCRMVSQKQREELACQWFSMEFVSNAFKGIKDSEFETDCRKFLNQVNGMLGDKRRVFTYPCLSAALDNYELQIPMDENLEEFWIDFNVGSRSISFYVAVDAALQWETVIIPEEEVDLYTIEEKDSRKLLTIALKSPMNVGNQEGLKFFLYFDSILEIKDVTRKIYGLSKCKGFSKKYSASVAKTTVHVVFDESGSQLLVPESQLSPCLEEKSEGEKLTKYKTQQLPGTLRTQNKNNSQEKSKDDCSKITASCKRKVSEASVLIPGIARFPTRSPLVFASTSTPCKGRYKMPLEMMSSAESSNTIAVNETRTNNFYQKPTGVCIPSVAKVLIDAKLMSHLDEVLDIVPDSQPPGRSNKSLPSDLFESSLDKTKTWKKRACSVPEKNITADDMQKQNPSLARTSQLGYVSSLYYNITNEESDVLFAKETENAMPSKTKTKSKEITDATKSLISKISDRYKQNADDKRKAGNSLSFNRPHLNKSSVFKEKLQARRTIPALNTTASHVMDDVYNFNISGFDEPTIKLGVQELSVTEPSVPIDPTKKGNAGDSETSTKVKERKKTRKNQNKKHLFSDTDTEYRGDDSKTEVSWLKESNRQSKDRIIDYSRNKNLWKPVSPDKTDKSSEPACHMDKPKGKNATKKKVNECKKENPRTDGTAGQSTRKKLPRRAALAKNYKEPSSSESDSEKESPVHTSKEEKSKIQKRASGKIKDDNLQKDLRSPLYLEPKTGACYVQKALIKSKNSAELKESEIPSFECPASPETMRCAERVSEDVTQEHAYSDRSPSLQESTPEQQETLSFEKRISPQNVFSRKKDIQSVCLNQSPEASVKKLTFGNKYVSPVLTEPSLISLTTCKVVNGKQAKGSVSEPRHDNEDLRFRPCLSDTLSIKGQQQDITRSIIKSKDEVFTKSLALQKRGAAFLSYLDVAPPSLSSGSKAQSWNEEPYGPVHKSGPTVQKFSKRRYHSGTESNSDEAEASSEEEKKGKRRPKLQPRKLFKTADSGTYRVSESMSTVSLNEVAVLDGESWEPDCSTISICQKLQKEFTRKIESRSQKMEHFTKQSLRAVHEHLATMSYQLHECRSKQMEKFHFALLEELENFEKDSQSLKSLEKEFSIFWKKHTQTFSTYRKNEQQRVQILRTSFEKNIYHTVDHEEHIFTSEMHLMKEDIKRLQEKLLREMQEEELCNVRRALQTIFRSEDRILK
ncbi:synaptonemal complex protein 2 [Dryobates pubescens]|uniref:synaptonemal complex protein 2 n=1 Tax=Dryobates pubescens TaxID=118200 RepID=UPI0023B8D5D0|nr:synaptonemal complex protein 2 [Dryobates pubescens]